MPELAIETTGLRRLVRGGVALAGVSIRVERSSSYALVGAPGAGKTTLLRVLAGLARPHSGQASVLGRTSPDPSRRARIGYMPVAGGVLPHLSIRENLRFFGDLYGFDRTDVDLRIAELEELLHLVAATPLPKDPDSPVRRRAALAVALLHQPELLLLDEPVDRCDPDLRKLLWGALTRARGSGTTVFLTTTELEVAARCDRIGMLAQGALLAEGTPEELCRRSGGRDLDEAWRALSRREGPT